MEPLAVRRCGRGRDLDPWIHGLLDPWIHEPMTSWVHGSMDPWIHESMDPWMHRSKMFVVDVFCGRTWLRIIVSRVKNREQIDFEVKKTRSSFNLDKNIQNRILTPIFSPKIILDVECFPNRPRRWPPPLRWQPPLQLYTKVMIVQ